MPQLLEPCCSVTLPKLAKLHYEPIHCRYLVYMLSLSLLSFFNPARAVGFEPTTNGFGDHYSTS